MQLTGWCIFSVCMLSPLQSCLTLWDPMDCSSPGSSVHGILQARILERLPCPSPEDLPDPGIEPASLMSPALASSHLKWNESCSVMSDSLWPHGLRSPWNSLGQNTGVGSHFLLQGILPTQGSNPYLLHCRQILYQLSHQVGGPSGKLLIFSTIAAWLP